MSLDLCKKTVCFVLVGFLLCVLFFFSSGNYKLFFFFFNENSLKFLAGKRKRIILQSSVYPKMNYFARNNLEFRSASFDGHA